MSHRGDLAAERKLQIIQATLKCIAERGYHNLSMQDVANKAGLSKGIIHYYFENKQDLMKSVLGRVSQEIEQLLVKIDDTAEPIEQIKQMIRLYCGIVYKDRIRYCVNIDFWAQINQYPKFKLMIADHYSTFRSRTAEVLKRNIPKSRLKEIDVNYAASMLIGLVDGISLQWLFDKKEFDFNNMVKKCEEIFINYIYNYNK